MKSRRCAKKGERVIGSQRTRVDKEIGMDGVRGAWSGRQERGEEDKEEEGGS